MMTEQEAEAWAARLTRIWTPEKVVFECEPCPNGYFEYRGWIRSDVCLEVDHDLGDIHFDLHLEVPYTHVALMATMKRGMVDDSDDVARKLRRHLLEEWTPFFRRNCWLSGCPIEASAHEKAEWIQGFSQEELQSWNLKT